MGRIRLVESVVLSPGKDTLEKRVMEAFGGDIPSVLYPEIRAITADKVTRNKTFYPSESLIGNEAEGTGVYSILYPYPIPIIQDHATATGLLGSESSPVYGRAKYAKFVPGSNGSGGYVSVIPAITDPTAIEMILTERFLTVSIGVETESVTCSICNGSPYLEDGCDHVKGQTYFIDGRLKECYYIVGPVRFHEVSFVIVPSDTDARVINKQVQVEDIKILGGESSNKGEIILKEHASDFNNLKRMWSIPVKNTQATNTEPVVETKVPETKVTTTEEPKVTQKSCLIVFKDEKKNVEYPLLTLSKNSVKPIYATVESSNIPQDYKNRLYTSLIGYCKEEKVDVPESLKKADHIIETLEKNSTRQPVRVPLDESTYPVLYALIEALEQHTMELSTSMDKARKKNKKLAKAAHKEDHKLDEQIEALNEKCMEVGVQAHLRLASEVAILSKVLNKPAIRERSLDDCIKDFSKRTTQSLEDSLSDLLLEFNGSAPVSIEAIEKVKSPVIKTDETEVAPKQLGKVGEVTEVEEDSVYVHFGLDPKKLEKRLKEMQSSSNI